MPRTVMNLHFYGTWSKISKIGNVKSINYRQEDISSGSIQDSILVLHAGECQDLNSNAGVTVVTRRKQQSIRTGRTTANQITQTKGPMEELLDLEFDSTRVDPYASCFFVTGTDKEQGL